MTGDVTTARVTVDFQGFWPHFDPSQNPFVRALERWAEVRRDPTQPDLLIFSHFGPVRWNGKSTRIFFTGENHLPDMSRCDWAIGSRSDGFPHGRYIRFPLFAYESDELSPPSPPSPKEFCCFVYFKKNRRREKLCLRLRRLHRIHCPGAALNNEPPIEGATPQHSRSAPHWRQSKIEYMKQFRFTIAYENSAARGYTTEKLLDALAAGTIPIYWGNPEVDQDFNERRFINVHRIESSIRAQLPPAVVRLPWVKDLVERLWVERQTRRRVETEVRLLEADGERRKAMLAEPWFQAHQLTPSQWQDRLAESMGRILRERAHA